MRWPRCVAVILITGSISSTYGASDATAACAAAAPASAAALIGDLAIPAGQEVAYREEVRHPALAAPQVATGAMSVGADATLVRDQSTPERQISEIGARMLSTRGAPDAEPTLYPIPDRVRPMLQALRHVLAGDAAALDAYFASHLNAGPDGWTLTLNPRHGVPGPPLSFSGCGGALRQIRIPEEGGVERIIVFSPAR